MNFSKNRNEDHDWSSLPGSSSTERWHPKWFLITLVEWINDIIDRLAAWFELWGPPWYEPGSDIQFVVKIHFLHWLRVRIWNAICKPWDERFWRHIYEIEEEEIGEELCAKWHIAPSDTTIYGNPMSWKQRVNALRHTAECQREWNERHARPVGMSGEMLWSMVERNLGRPLKRVPSGISAGPK